jgi:hypothetical protein
MRGGKARSDGGLRVSSTPKTGLGKSGDGEDNELDTISLGGITPHVN